MAEDKGISKSVSIQLVDVDEIKSGRGVGRKGVRGSYMGYAKAVAPIVPWIKEQIAGSKDKTIRVKTLDITSQMGLGKKHETSVYWGLKFVLFQEGIVVTTSKTKKDEAVLVMREATDIDVLPESLRKKLPSTEDTNEDSVETDSDTEETAEPETEVPEEKEE